MPEKKNKHLTIADRVEIEKGLARGESFAAIARAICVSTSTVSREVKQNRTFSRIDKKAFNICALKSECRRTDVCGACPGGPAKCKGCRRVKCSLVCDAFVERACDRLELAPFICGDCPGS